MVYVLLADGFEEMEAIAPIDLLRRAGCTVQTVAVGSVPTVTGSHGITVIADLTIEHAATDGLQAVVLPGGLPGTTNLEASEKVHALIDYAWTNDLVLGAICAAPSVFGHKGILKGKRAVCYPGFEKELDGALVQDAAVVRDGTVITSKGAGTATDFALELVGTLVSPAMAQSLREGIQCK